METNFMVRKAKLGFKTYQGPEGVIACMFFIGIPSIKLRKYQNGQALPRIDVYFR
jgi:hypothetical protein